MNTQDTMSGVPKDPEKKYANWGGRRQGAGGPGKARLAQRKNPDEVATLKTTVRYGESFKKRFEVFRLSPDEETTDLFMRLMGHGLDWLEAIKLKSIAKALEQERRENESNAALIKRVLQAGLAALKLQASEK